MRDWRSHDFIDNGHYLKPFSAKHAIFDYKKTILQKLHQWISAVCTHIDLCVVHLHFLHGMNLQFYTFAMCMHVFMFYMWICTYFCVWFMSIGVNFILGTKRTIKWNLLFLPKWFVKVWYDSVYECSKIRNRPVVTNSRCETGASIYFGEKFLVFTKYGFPACG